MSKLNFKIAGCKSITSKSGKEMVRITGANEEVAIVSKKQWDAACEDVSPLDSVGAEITVEYFNEGDELISGICTKDYVIVKEFSLQLNLVQLTSRRAGQLLLDHMLGNSGTPPVSKSSTPATAEVEVEDLQDAE